MGTVFNIQHFSIHDGPGIRTVVFLKGCPLRCKWCANPESQKREPELGWTKKECIGCGECTKSLDCFGVRGETDEIFWDSAKTPVDEKVKRICPTEALHTIGQEMSPEEVVQEALKDVVFFRSSEGGITLSGGEPLMQADFSTEILRLAGKHGIHRTIETSSYADFADYAKVVKEVDFLITDIKIMDEEAHKKWTGVSNQLILENLRAIRKNFPNLKIQVRTPVIPGVNNTRESIEEIISFVNEINADYELLQYHKMGIPKYESLHRPYPFGEDILSTEEFQELEAFAIEKFTKGLPWKHYGPAKMTGQTTRSMLFSGGAGI